MIRFGHNSGSPINTTPTTAVRSCLNFCLVPYKTVATFSPAFVRAYLFGALDPPNTGWHQAIGFEWGVILTFQNFYPASSGRTVNIRYGVGTTPGTYATVVAPNDAGATLTQFFVEPSWYVLFEFINDGTFDGPTSMALANLTNGTSIIGFSVEFAP